jgi:hypothetical protein
MLSERWDAFKTMLSESWDSLKKAIGEKFDSFIKSIGEKWSLLKTYFTDFINDFRKLLHNLNPANWFDDGDTKKSNNNKFLLDRVPRNLADPKTYSKPLTSLMGGAKALDSSYAYAMMNVDAGVTPGNGTDNSRVAYVTQNYTSNVNVEANTSDELASTVTGAVDSGMRTTISKQSSGGIG